jgi:hypothetical protein
LEPVVRGSVEVAGGEENLLRFRHEEFRAAEEVVAALGEVQVELVSVPGEHVGRGHFCTAGLWERLWRRRRRWRERCSRWSRNGEESEAFQSLAHPTQHVLHGSEPELLLGDLVFQGL